MTCSAVISPRATVQPEGRPTFGGAITEGARLLAAAGLDSARLDAEVLLSHALGIDKTELYLAIDAPLNLDGQRRYRDLLLRRERREPVAYITGRKEFWSLDFIVTPDVLIPRPETELLVEVALERSKACAERSQLKILDLGTGSGAIAVSLARELPEARLTSVDISPAALAVACRNGERQHVANRISFGRGDLFEVVCGTFDLIVANPPYVRRAELARLPPEIREWEPVGALDGGVDGLDFYRRIIAEAHRYLVTGGHLILEIGADMGAAVTELFTRAGCYESSCVYQDYAGKDRIIAATKTPSSNPAAKGSARG
jgi:release factor glutamine methyltransferase